jgi:VanZ family protein
MDKVVHLIMYGVFGYLLFESLMNSIKKMFLSIIITVVLSFLLGIFVEITQEYFIKNRSGDFYDAAANLSGALFGSLLKCFMYRKNIK